MALRNIGTGFGLVEIYDRETTSWRPVTAAQLGDAVDAYSGLGERAVAVVYALTDARSAQQLSLTIAFESGELLGAGSVALAHQVLNNSVNHDQYLDDESRGSFSDPAAIFRTISAEVASKPYLETDSVETWA